MTVRPLPGRADETTGAVLVSTNAATTRRRSPRAAIVVTIVALAALVVAFFVWTSMYTDYAWYAQLGFQKVLTTKWFANIGMFFAGFFGMAIPVFASITVAFRLRPVYTRLGSQLDRYQQVLEPLRRAVMFGVPAVFGLFAGLACAPQWTMVLQYLNRTPFGKKDPQFHLDIGFYVFELPFFRSLVAFASAVVLISGLVALATCYLYGSFRIGQRELRITRPARVQLAVTIAVYIALQAVSLWLDQYATLTKDNSLITGAQYTDINATIPGRQILAGVAVIVTLLFIFTAIVGRWRVSIIGTGLLLVAAIIIGGIYPWGLQRFQVHPSERSYESQSIQRNINATRDAYGVATTKEKSYGSTKSTSSAALAEEATSSANIRLIDPDVVSDTFSQLEQSRQYYQFSKSLDVDRYKIGSKTEDTVIGVRDIDLDGLGSSATAYNSAFVYTHGYGVVAAYSDRSTSDGKPVFLESGIPSSGKLASYQQRVYFGKNSPSYSIVGGTKDSKKIELDYPSGDDDSSGDNTTTMYSGDGGPKVGSFASRLAYAVKFQSEQILLSNAVNSESQILYNRDPVKRVQAVAPYLTLDKDTYPAIVNHRLVWLVDGYTTSDAYPYSQSESLSGSINGTSSSSAYSGDQVNYIRNSVKATVDAYTGKVTLYSWDKTDPVLKTWQKVFPTELKSVSQMSAQLLEHVRYPTDLFKVQRTILGTYHVTDAKSYYSNNDAWTAPADPNSSSSSSKTLSTSALGTTTTTSKATKLQDPYYLTMTLPGQGTKYTLYSTYQPQQTGSNARNSLTGYLAVDSDAGGAGKGKVASGYGKLTLLTPTSDNVAGPAQIQNKFNSNATVSQELNILKRGDSTVKRGNLLTLPIGGGFLYVEPVYVESTSDSSYPLLQKVLVAYGDKIAFKDTLSEALTSVFGAGSGGSSAANSGSSDSDSSDSSSSDSSSTENSALKKAVAAAEAALQAREKAYADNDLVAAAEADKKLQQAVQDANEAATSSSK